MRLTHSMNVLYNGLLCPLLLLSLALHFSSGKPGEVCVSQGGRFPPFSSEGKPPKRATKGPKDLTLCRVFRRRTCCDVSQTHPALISIRRLASTGEAGEDCLQLWEMLECSICDPHVGVQPGPPVICASFCDAVFEACSNAYFSMDGKSQILAPCGVSDFVCGRASQWVNNGTELCHAAGYSVTPSDLHLKDAYCFGGKASIDAVADSWKASRSEMQKKVASMGLFRDFQQWVNGMSLRERFSWALGAVVLTTGLLFGSKKKSNNQRRRQAAIQRSAKKLEAKMNEKSSRNKRGSAK